MKRIIKKAFLWLSYNLKPNNYSKIIYYHDIGQRYTQMGTDLSLFKTHISIIKDCGYDIVENINQHHNQIMICFDDGWAGIYEHKDFFVNAQIYPTIFIAVALIGRPGYLTLKQIIELQDLGFHFESHTWNHEDLTTFTENELFHELKQAKDELSFLLGKDVNDICFPKGRFSRHVYEQSIKAGYKKLYSSIPGAYYDKYSDMNIICRKLVQFADANEFRYILNSTSTYVLKRAIRLHFKK